MLRKGTLNKKEIVIDYENKAHRVGGTPYKWAALYAPL